ncbi:hypothetical protein ABIE12_001735 [Serratia sp. 509]
MSSPVYFHQPFDLEPESHLPPARGAGLWRSAAGWPQQSPVLTVTQGCWILVEDHQDLEQAARQVLWLRPDWGRQLSVIPQKHADDDGTSQSNGE